MTEGIYATAGRKSLTRAFSAIAWGGFVAGTLDIVFAFITFWIRGATPLRILRGIASGLVGSAALDGGLPAAALGLALHYFISFSAAAFFWFSAVRFPILLRQAVPSGIAYGLAFYLFMTQVVLPLSAITSSNPRALDLSGVFAHTILFGLPIALIARRAARAQSPGPSPHGEHQDE